MLRCIIFVANFVVYNEETTFTDSFFVPLVDCRGSIFAVAVGEYRVVADGAQRRLV